jgi:hypothetical protein
MKSKPEKVSPENSDKKLSRLIEKLNAELKVMNELNSNLAEKSVAQSDRKSLKPKKNSANLKTNKK